MNLSVNRIAIWIGNWFLFCAAYMLAGFAGLGLTLVAMFWVCLILFFLLDRRGM